MKKIVFSLMTIGAMFLTTQNIQAQEDEEIPEVETEVTAQVAQDEFAEVDVMALPQAVKEALLTDYNGAVAKEAWVKTKEDKKIYKLKIDVKGETEKLYVDQDGKWLEKEDIESSEK